MSDPVRDRLRAVENRIDEACRRVGRSRQEVTLVGASKVHPPERLLEAHDAGLTAFGENRVQEAAEKKPLLPDSITWHLIGPLQSNKARRAAELFDVVQSVDRMKVARALDRAAGEAGRALEAMIQVRLGAEESKHGFDPAELEAALPALAELEHLRIEGLMAIPPFESDPEDSRRWFRQLREIRDRIWEQAPWRDRGGWLSMGMSHDFEMAIEEGATHVRIGTALFGPRRSEA